MKTSPSDLSPTGHPRTQARLEQRRASVPPVKYSPNLPVSQYKEELATAIAAHQVVIVAGETGSGKTTQLPKICLELGRGINGMIGHTQPRRLAARTVAERIAEELATPLGGVVGYQVRFQDRANHNTLVKLMTDGILLAELASDRNLRQYDTLIIDEAHERSLNIDFILGYLKHLLPRRPDLKVIITSATIDPQRFSQHFADAPIIEVSGRTYPVEVRYRPIVNPDNPEFDRDQTQAILDAVVELSSEPPGDILVFLSGEREIRDTAEALAKANLSNTEVLPLYARLSANEQHRIFQSHTGRRIVLATNVAETSLTVPGIKYVIDPGTARISRYSHRTKVQRLPIEPISQASANQRKGRCGRTSDGICIRLYSEADFDSRPQFTDPEILRTSLAAVILQMTSLGLGEVAAFPFIDPPDRRDIKAGVDLLEELGALNTGEKNLRKRLTKIGHMLARLPVDPRLARMIIEADRNGCVHEVMVITAALSIQDPRERPSEQQQAADEKHRRFVEKESAYPSDFSSYLTLWNYLAEQQKTRSANQFRKMCKAEFLNYLRVREWQDLYSQLHQAAKAIGISLNSTRADSQRIHVSLLAGLLSHIGLMNVEKREYQGARNARFAVFPGSALFKKPPRWVMAAELVETSRLWGRIAARIEPEWVEPLAHHLVKRSYSEPHWEAKQGAVVAYEKVTLYGIPIVTRRKINYGRVDPELARELFIRHALVEGDWHTHHTFFSANRELLADVEELEHRARRHDILVDDQTLFDFYDQRIPADIISARHFDSWWKKTRPQKPELLTFSPSLLINTDSEEVSQAEYPNEWIHKGITLPLNYHFEPGTKNDGVTVDIPLTVLNQIDEEDFAWQVPGLRHELVTALIRALPKPLRVNFVPAPDRAAAALARIRPRQGSLFTALERELHRITGIAIPPDAWQLDRVPPHLRITFRIINEKNQTLAEGKDLLTLKERLKPKLQTALSQAAGNIEQQDLTTWSFDKLPNVTEQQRDGHLVRGYPALVDAGDSVAIQVFANESEQQHAMWTGSRRLLLLNMPWPGKAIQGQLSNQSKLVLSQNPHGSVAGLLNDCINCAVDKLITDNGGPVWDATQFAKLRDTVRTKLADTVLAVLSTVEQILKSAHTVEAQLKTLTNPMVLAAHADMTTQFENLIYPNFITATGWHQLSHVARYLQGIVRRIEKLPHNVARDRELMIGVQDVQNEYQELLKISPKLPVDPDLQRIRWMIEELRISYFAQMLGTPYSISEQRIFRALDDLGS